MGSKQTLGNGRGLSVTVELVEIANAILGTAAGIQIHEEGVQQQHLIVCVLQEVGVPVDLTQVTNLTFRTSHRPGTKSPRLLQASVDGFDHILRGYVHLLVQGVVDNVLDRAAGLEKRHGVNHGEVDWLWDQRGTAGRGQSQQSLKTDARPPAGAPAGHPRPRRMQRGANGGRGYLRE